jgi:hypothetical protein
MEILNKKTNGYKAYRSGEPPLITFGYNRNRIALNLTATTIFGFKKEYFVHFIIDFDRVYFYANKDDSGLPFSIDGSSLRVQSKPIFSMLMKRLPTKIIPGSCFEIRQILTKINEEKSYEILLNTKKMTRKYGVEHKINLAVTA